MFRRDSEEKRLIGLAALCLAAGLGWGAEAPQAAGRTDRYGDPLPAGALARLGTTRWRHGTPVTYVAFLPDGKAVLTVSLDDIVRLWDLATGKEIRRVGGQPAGNRSVVGIIGGRFVFRHSGFNVALAPQGKTLAVAGPDNVIQIWDMPSGKKLRSIPTPTTRPNMLLFSPDGKTLAGRSGMSSVSLWDAAAGKELWQITIPVKNGGSASINGMAFSPDNKVLAAGVTIFEGGKGAFAVKSWDAASGKELRHVSIPAPGVYTMAFAPDGKTLAYTEAGPTVHICEAGTGKEIRRLQGPGGGIVSLTYSPDGKTLAVRVFVRGRDPSAHLLDVETGRVRHQLGEVTFFGRSEAFSPDGRLVATGGSSSVRLWEVATGKEVSPDNGHQGFVTSLILAPGGVVVSKGADHTIRLWDSATGKERRRLPVPEGTTCAALAADGRLAALGNADGTIRLHETATGKELHKLKGHPNPARVAADGPRTGVGVVAFSGDGKVLASRGIFDQTIRLYEGATGALPHGCILTHGSKS